MLPALTCQVALAEGRPLVCNHLQESVSHVGWLPYNLNLNSLPLIRSPPTRGKHHAARTDTWVTLSTFSSMPR